MSDIDSAALQLHACVAGTYETFGEDGASALAVSVEGLTSEESAELVQRELHAGAQGALGPDASQDLFVCIATSMSGEQLAGVMLVLSDGEQGSLLQALNDFGSLNTQREFAARWDIEACTPKLHIDAHIKPDVLWPSLTKFSPSEMREMLTGAKGVPSFGERTAPALARSAANFTPLVQYKLAFSQTSETQHLVEPRYQEAGQHWAIEAGGITAEHLQTSGALLWWVPSAPSPGVAAVHFREKIGLAYANAEFQHENFGTVHASLSSGVQGFAWGVATVSTTGWDVGCFAGVEAVAAKLAAQYQSPEFPVVGTLGVVRMRASVSGDLNVGAAGGDIGLGTRGDFASGKFSVYGQIGFSPGVGWRVLPILDVRVDTEKAGVLADSVNQAYLENPAREPVEALMRSPIAAQDLGPALGGLYLAAVIKTVGPKVIDEIVQAGEDVREGIGIATAATLDWLDAQKAVSPAQRSPVRSDL